MTPGTINLSVLQTGLARKKAVALRLACAAAIIEYLYAWIAVSFEKVITAAPAITIHFRLIAAIVITTLGIITLVSASKPSKFSEKFSNSGFRRGIMLGILNPLAMPYWIGITAYLRSQHWIDLSTTARLHAYLLGVSLGVLSLLTAVTFLAGKLVAVVRKESVQLKRFPGYIMVGLGVFAFIKYFISNVQ